MTNGGSWHILAYVSIEQWILGCNGPYFSLNVDTFFEALGIPMNTKCWGFLKWGFPDTPKSSDFFYRFPMENLIKMNDLGVFA